MICKEWDDYGQFREWAMSSGYTDELSIDRIDVNGNYYAENCRWADAKMQANNVSRNHMLEYKGQRMTISEFADYLGLSYATLQHRIERGWALERITSTPQKGVRL